MPENNRDAIEAILRTRTDLADPSTPRVLADILGPQFANLPEGELRPAIDAKLATGPYKAVFIRSEPPNPVAQAVAAHQAHVNTVGLRSGVAQGMGHAPLPAPPGYQPPPAPGLAPAEDAPISIEARSLFGHISNTIAVNRSGFTPFGKAR